MSLITLKDVASKSGVSLSTASLVLNGKGNISQEVREKVVENARVLGYLKNIHAAATASRSSRHVAVLVDESYEKAFEWNLIRSILIPLEATLSQAGYYPLLLPVTLDQPVARIVEKVVMSGAGALFAIHFGSEELFRRLEDRELPVVILNHNRASQDYYSVTDDFIYGTYEATTLLLERGHRNLWFIDYDRPDLPAIVFDRRVGFDKAIAHFGTNDAITQHTITIRDLQDNDEVAEVAERLRKESQQGPIALAAHDDFVAARIVAILEKLGVDVPNDVSIASPGDTLDYSLPFIPQITTFRTDYELMGKLAGQMLLRRFEGDSSSVEALKVQRVLMDRGSVRSLDAT